MKKEKYLIKPVLPAILSLALILSFSVTASAAQPYIHDPMANPNAAKDIVVDPGAVYGYAPSPNSSRLKDYTEYDWSDPELVAKMRQQREEYHDSMKELYSIITTMRTAGASVKDIAIAVSTRRNEIRLEAYKNDPEGLAKVKKSNLENYGNENGGTPEFFYNKYGSWEMVAEKALSVNAGADACLGLYDKYYDTYFIVPSDGKTGKTDKGNLNQPSASDHTVTAGESLSGIAERSFGDKTKWTVIYDMNRDTVKDPNLIYPGQVLRIK
jgi:LysM repeat protein